MQKSPVSRYKLIVFDWDGTLVDSIPKIIKALKLAALDRSLPVLEDRAFCNVVGMSLLSALAKLYPWLDETELDELRVAYGNHHRILEQNPSLFFSGVAEGLDVIRSTGVYMAVATGKRRPGFQRSMLANGCENVFHASKTADDAVSKPNPDMIQQLLFEFSLFPSQVLMVGDSIFDMEMARAAMVDRVAVSYGAQPSEVLEAYDPIIIVDDFGAIVRWLGNGRL